MLGGKEFSLLFFDFCETKLLLLGRDCMFLVLVLLKLDLCYDEHLYLVFFILN